VEAARVTQQATWLASVPIAAELSVMRGKSLSERSVQYWGEPQADKPGPVYSMAQLILALREAQPDRDRALAPIYWLCTLAGVAPPGAPLDRAPLGPLERDVAAGAGAFGRLLEHLDEVLADGRVDADERHTARCLLAELVTKSERIMRHLDAVVAKGAR